MAAERILVVEANPHSSRRLQEAFETEGYEVLVANNGQEAWSICRRRLPQAIVLAVKLPDMSGYELLRRVRGALRTRHIHVTFVTEHSERRDKIAGLEMGADDYIVKPYDIEEMRLRIRNAISRANAGNLVNPATGLPGRRLIEEQLRELLRRQDNWAMLRVVLQHLDELADVHGFLAGEEVLRTSARILSEALDEWGAVGDFIGHSGGDEFVIITSAEAGSKLASVLVTQLEKHGRTHYSESERQQGFVTLHQSDGSQVQAPLLNADIHIITSADGPFHDIMQLTSALG